MAKLFVVVDSIDDWAIYYPSQNIITVTDYIHLPLNPDEENTQIINLCSSYKYQSKGYYCSLLAEARNHRVIPSIKSINDISKKSIYSLDLEDLESHVQAADFTIDTDRFEINIYCGKTEHQSFSNLSRKIFEAFSFPILKVKFVKEKHWQIEKIKPISLSSLKEKEEDLFAAFLNEFSKKIWRRPRAKKTYLYDLAILRNKDEVLPPSNKTALKNFVRAGKRVGFDVEFISKQDYGHLTEYDALFIRETTSLNNHTYRFSKKAESYGMVVMDDPNSILRCTNKVYLANLLQVNGIRSPKTIIIDKEDPNYVIKVESSLLYPIILKIPDGSFSLGISKIENREILLKETLRLFERTHLLIAQEYIYTEFDWRIGVLNKQALFACKYFMTKGHWQIYKHSEGRVMSGNSLTFPINQVPKDVIRVAIKSASLIGDGLYGVDIKMINEIPVVIEINDNPNIDSNIEDKVLGDDLYLTIMQDFLRRLEIQRK